ncbi:MAG TPA: hypothetical protein VKI43_10570 [Vicinamibacterales bacterium]|nr:hypothetical protein [Vicinamibacterales bacterium]
MTKTKKKKDASSALSGLLPHLRDSVDKEGLPVSFILKKGRDRADAKATPKTSRVGKKK